MHNFISFLFLFIFMYHVHVHAAVCYSIIASQICRYFCGVIFIQQTVWCNASRLLPMSWSFHHLHLFLWLTVPSPKCRSSSDLLQGAGNSMSCMRSTSRDVHCWPRGWFVQSTVCHRSPKRFLWSWIRYLEHTKKYLSQIHIHLTPSSMSSPTNHNCLSSNRQNCTFLWVLLATLA